MMAGANICRDVIKPGFVKSLVQRFEAFSAWTQTAASPVQQCIEVVPSKLMVLQPIKGQQALAGSLECGGKPAVVRCHCDFVVFGDALCASISARASVCDSLGVAIADIGAQYKTIGVT
jgi:hypothetical protein